MINLKYIVTGTGRCGTLFMANLLTSMGYPCAHEAIFTPKGIEKAKKIIKKIEPAISSRISREENLSDYELEIVAESSYMAAPFLKEFDAKVIHVVRNPMDVVASMTGPFFRLFENQRPVQAKELPERIIYEKFIYGHLEELEQKMSQIERCCLFYIRWNQMIEKSGKCVLRHRIEDDVHKIKELLGFKGEKCYENKKCNSKISSIWSVSDISNTSIKKELLNIMEKYGYMPQRKLH